MKGSLQQNNGGAELTWYNEPQRWVGTIRQLSLTTDRKTDFWRITHYGFTRDNGHFLFTKQSGNFLASVKVSGNYRALYDQAGLMIRLDEKNWIKSGIEFVHGVHQVSAVVTRNFSDWSVVPLIHTPDALWLRLLRKEDYVEISYSLDGNDYQMLRLAYFPSDQEVQIGLMGASPDGEGFDILFEGFEVAKL